MPYAYTEAMHHLRVLSVFALTALSMTACAAPGDADTSGDEASAVGEATPKLGTSAVALPDGRLASSLGVLGVNQTGKLTMTLSATHIVTAVAFSTAVGLFFGWYPARRASRLLPIECLRQD